MKSLSAPDPAECLARLRLARTEGVGPMTFRRLLQRHGSARAALAALPGYAAQRSGTSLRPPPEAAAQREIDALGRMGARLLHLGTPGYPGLLALTEDAPPVLALLGDPAALSLPAVAIVGARNASAAGRRMAESLAEGLSGAGHAVVSGLARGVDAAAHLGALHAGAGCGSGSAGAGCTLAAIAGGLDQPYPPEHAGLQARIAAEGGAVLAEAPLGTAPQARHFPRRNRIVAGLALGVVVVEAAQRSGSLITARLALDMGRDLFAVPGSPLDPRCRGSNDLIRQGAHLVETVDDVLRELPLAPRDTPLFALRQGVASPPEAPPAGPIAAGEAHEVFELLGNTPVTVDDLSRRCHLSAATLQAILLDLELAGRVEMLPGHRVVLAGAA